MTALKTSAVVSYIIGIITFFSVPLIFVYSRSDYSGAALLFFSPQYWLFILYYLCIYFLLSKVILPVLYEKGRYFLLTVVMILFLASAVYIKPFDRLMHRSGDNRPMRSFNDKPPLLSANETTGERPPKPGGNQKFSPPLDIVSVFLLVMLILIVISTESVKRWRITEQRAIQAEAEKAHAELSFLKAQINPHFLFNTLNNIYSLAVTKDDKSADAIMKLSNIMRYITDDANEMMVPLQSEIDCINNYISLQKMRFGQNCMIQFSVPGSLENKRIPPLTLITFVENAFKHGISNHEQTNIIIKILAVNTYIHFFEQNTVFAKPANMERTGIGIENTKKRLQALYPDKHLLKIEKNDKLYIVELILYS